MACETHDAPYQPIDCALHDRLLDWATRRRPLYIEYTDAAGKTVQTAGVIVDVYTRGRAEFLRLADGQEIRLDRLRRVEES